MYDNMLVYLVLFSAIAPYSNNIGAISLEHFIFTVFFCTLFWVSL